MSSIVGSTNVLCKSVGIYVGLIQDCSRYAEKVWISRTGRLRPAAGATGAAILHLFILKRLQEPRATGKATNIIQEPAR